MKHKTLILIVLVFSMSQIQAQKIWNVLCGDYPNPSIVRVGEDFYMTNSSHNYVPGLLIWHSKDLKNWNPINYALNQYIGDIWSPDFIYYKAKYYIYFPAKGSNYVVTADNPNGPWSSPIDLKTNGMDPGHIVTPEGERYLYFNNGWMIQLTDDGLSTIGKKKKAYDGWPIPPTWNIECFCLESPKLMHLNGFYYMTSAQGGTAGPSTSHMVVSARSESINGPWENSAYNPIVRTWSPDETWWSKGHGTIFDDSKGNWYVIYHAYKKNELDMGRQVLIEPIKWTDDHWFKLKRKPTKEPLTQTYNNFSVQNDDFEGKALKTQWQFSGINSLSDIDLGNGALSIPSVKDTLKVVHTNCPNKYFSATVKLKAEGDDLEYGFVLYYNETNFIGLGMKSDKLYAIVKGEKGKGPTLKNENFTFFQLIRNYNDLQMASSSDGISWQLYPMGKEVSAYQHNMLGDFRNLKLGIYCRGKGRLTIDDFKYNERLTKQD